MIIDGFSYSDKNFTVVGNLCFVHIILDGTESMIDIPPAISDRMLYPRIICTSPDADAYAMITSGGIYLTKKGLRYLYLYFPIDSNK